MHQQMNKFVIRTSCRGEATRTPCPLPSTQTQDVVGETAVPGPRQLVLGLGVPRQDGLSFPRDLATVFQRGSVVVSQARQRKIVWERD